MSSPAITRSATTSAWSFDSPATMATACRVESSWNTSSSTGFPDVTGDGAGPAASTLSLNRLRDRAASMARCRAIVNSQARNSSALSFLNFGQVADHLQPGLSGDVVDVIAADYPQVPQEARLQRVPEHEEARLIAGPGLDERFVERSHARFPHPLPRMTLFAPLVSAL